MEMPPRRRCGDDGELGRRVKTNSSHTAGHFCRLRGRMKFVRISGCSRRWTVLLRFTGLGAHQYRFFCVVFYLTQSAILWMLTKMVHYSAHLELFDIEFYYGAKLCIWCKLVIDIQCVVGVIYYISILLGTTVDITKFYFSAVQS